MLDYGLDIIRHTYDRAIIATSFHLGDDVFSDSQRRKLYSLSYIANGNILLVHTFELIMQQNLGIY